MTFARDDGWLKRTFSQGDFYKNSHSHLHLPVFLNYKELLLTVLLHSTL